MLNAVGDRTSALPIESSPARADQPATCVETRDARRFPAAVYRLQFNREFTFQQARALVPYLASLGVSDVYSSPFIKARAGSRHGYDIVDHNSFNPEIGSLEEFEALAGELQFHGMNQLVDVVPNHMGIATWREFTG